MPAGLKIDAAMVGGWVDRFEQLWGASQWKRERLAAGFHLDDFSVDSRTYCRFPIFSG
jgi:NAD+ synthase (glutamine-hydrolysing)